MALSRRYVIGLLGFGGLALVLRGRRNRTKYRKADDTDDLYWVTPTAKRTTQAPCLDVARLLPELVPHAVTTVRLHPRRGPEPPRDGNKIGGLFFWPRNRDWPVCEEHLAPFVGVLQLRKEDFPEMRFPEAKDLFQLLWCPQNHQHSESWTKPIVFWHARAEATAPAEMIPPPRIALDDYLPFPCLLLPERVTEYPCEDLGQATKNRIERWSVREMLGPEAAKRPLDAWGRDIMDQPIDLYHFELSACPATKIGGYPSWIQRDETPICRCGRRMEHLLTMASWECDGGDFRRWLPKEDAHLQNPWPQAVTHAHGMMFGDAGSICYFICHHCPDWPVKSVAQCS